MMSNYFSTFSPEPRTAQVKVSKFRLAENRMADAINQAKMPAYQTTQKLVRMALDLFLRHRYRFCHSPKRVLQDQYILLQEW